MIPYFLAGGNNCLVVCLVPSTSLSYHSVYSLAVFPKDSLPLNTQLSFPVRFACSIYQPSKLLHALYLTTLRTLPCSKFIVPFNISIALDLCTKDKKCKLQHQICKKVKGTYVCDCSEGYYHGFRKCEGNALQFLPTLKSNIRADLEVKPAGICSS